MWCVPVVQSEQHMICRLTASGGQGGPSKHGRNWQRKTAVSGSSPQLTLKKGAPGDQVWDLLCVQLASYLERGPLMWMMPLHLHVNQKSDYDMIWWYMVCTNWWDSNFFWVGLQLFPVGLLLFARWESWTPVFKILVRALTIDSDDSDDDVSSVYSVCSNCKHPAKKGEDLKCCSRCHITRYCSVECQRKDWDFHRFACAVVAKKSDTVKA